MNKLVKYFTNSFIFLKLISKEYNIKLPKPLLLKISKMVYISNINPIFLHNININEYIKNGYGVTFLSNIVMKYNLRCDGYIPHDLLIEFTKKRTVNEMLINSILDIVNDKTQYEAIINTIIKNEVECDLNIKKLSTNFIHSERIAKLIYRYIHYINDTQFLRCIVTNKYIIENDNFNLYNYVKHILKFDDDLIVDFINVLNIKSFLHDDIIQILNTKSYKIKKILALKNPRLISKFTFTEEQLKYLFTEMDPVVLIKYNIIITPIIATTLYNLNKNYVRIIPKHLLTQKMCDDAILFDPHNINYYYTTNQDVILSVINNGSRDDINACSIISHMTFDTRMKILEKYPEFILNFVHLTKEEIWYVLGRDLNNIKAIPKKIQTKQMCKLAIKYNFDNVRYCRHIPRKLLWNYVKEHLYGIVHYKYLTKSLIKHLYKIHKNKLLIYITEKQLNEEIIEYLYELYGKEIIKSG